MWRKPTGYQPHTERQVGLGFVPLWQKIQAHTYVTPVRHFFRVTAFTKSVINAEPTRSFS